MKITFMDLCSDVRDSEYPWDKIMKESFYRKFTYNIILDKINKCILKISNEESKVCIIEGSTGFDYDCGYMHLREMLSASKFNNRNVKVISYAVEKEKFIREKLVFILFFYLFCRVKKVKYRAKREIKKYFLRATRRFQISISFSSLINLFHTICFDIDAIVILELEKSEKEIDNFINEFIERINCAILIVKTSSKRFKIFSKEHCHIVGNFEKEEEIDKWGAALLVNYGLSSDDAIAFGDIMRKYYFDIELIESFLELVKRTSFHEAQKKLEKIRLAFENFNEELELELYLKGVRIELESFLNIKNDQEK